MQYLYILHHINLVPNITFFLDLSKANTPVEYQTVTRKSKVDFSKVFHLTQLTKSIKRQQDSLNDHKTSYYWEKTASS